MRVTFVMVAALAVCSVWARRLTPSVGDMSRGTTEAPPLCDTDIVSEKCDALSPVRDTMTRADVQQMMSANDRSVAELWDALALTDNPTCMEVCQAVIRYVDKVGVLPPASDVVCYKTETEVKCNRYVGPEVLPTLVRKGDLPSSLVESDGVHEEADGKAVEEGGGVKAVGGSAVVSDGQNEGIDYGTWEIVKRVAYIFRIFPEATPMVDARLGTSMAEMSQTSKDWPSGGAEMTFIKKAESKAYVMNTIAAYDRKKTKRQMTRWFGASAFKDDGSRKKILHTLNSVLKILDNVYFVPRGRECAANTYAYVYPNAYKKCAYESVSRKPCTTTYTGEFVIYLCNYYFSKVDEMIETLVHEASHHSVAYLDDKKYQGESAYGRTTCSRLAKANPRSAIMNADNFCYYVQDVAEEVRSTSGSDAKVPVVIPAAPGNSGIPEDPYEYPEDLSHVDDDDHVQTCMRSGPTGMHVKSLKPDRRGNCHCKFASLTCYEGDTTKCPYAGGPSTRSRHHAKFLATCFTCSCKY